MPARTYPPTCIRMWPGGTALASSLPPWVADGGQKKLLERLHDPATRSSIKQELKTEHPDWENLFLDSGGASGVLIAGIQKTRAQEVRRQNHRADCCRTKRKIPSMP